MPAPSATSATDLSTPQIAAWVKRRANWSRSDTTRWLDARGPGVLAWLRRRGLINVQSVHAARLNAAIGLGRWLHEHAREDFARAHARLAALAPGSNREKISVPEVLR